ncbi:MAG: ABC transporter permease [Microbacteriaceae bacterium]|nr:ABC transporter permease [Microbacteriaceae bacterium]
MSNENKTARRLEHFVAPFDINTLAPVDAPRVESKPANLWSDAWRDIRRRPMFWISAFILLLVAAVALFPGLFTQADPRYCDNKLSRAPAGGSSLLGYTMGGCDIFARIIHGTSTSISVGVITVAITLIVGVIFGALAGFFGGFVDTLLSRIGDIFFSVPYMLAAIVVMSVLASHRNVWVISLALGGFAWPSTARILRAEILRVRSQDFVLAAKAIGLSRIGILIKHVLPNSIAPVIVITTLALAGAIVGESALSFLGLGLPDQFLSWGNEISKAQERMRTDPHLLLYPSLALIITVLGFIMMGEVVRDALDPKARARR